MCKIVGNQPQTGVHLGLLHLPNPLIGRLRPSFLRLIRMRMIVKIEQIFFLQSSNFYFQFLVFSFSLSLCVFSPFSHLFILPPAIHPFAVTSLMLCRQQFKSLPTGHISLSFSPFVAVFRALVRYSLITAKSPFFIYSLQRTNAPTHQHLENERDA